MTKQKTVLSGYAVITLTLPLSLACNPNCIVLGDRGDFLSVAGKVVDAESSTPVQGAFVGSYLLKDGTRIVGGEPLTPGGRPQWQPTTESGSFTLGFLFGFAPICASPFGPELPPPELPTPDQVEIVVLRDGCESRFTLDINSDTVVDPNIPDPGTPGRTDFVIELKNPIFVPVCAMP